MQLDQLLCFTTLADQLHFGRAAGQLRISTSALSKRVRELERELGVRLFERTSRQVRVTPAGATLLESARRVLVGADAFRELAQEAAAGRAGQLRAAYSSGNGEIMAKLVRALRTSTSTSLIDLQVEQRLSAEVVEAVRRGDVSVGICRWFTIPREVAAITVASSPRDVLVVAADHPLAGRREVRAHDLVGETFLLPHPSIFPQTQSTLPRALLKAGTLRFEETRTEDAMLDRIAVGQGILLTSAGLVSRHPRSDIATCRYVGPPHPPPGKELFLWRIDDSSPVVAAVVAAAKKLRSTMRATEHAAEVDVGSA